MSYLDIFSLEGKVALVPGGGGAIGSAIASALAGAGAKVVVANRTLASAEAAAARIRDAGGDAIAVTADATSEADAERVVAETIERFGSIDIIVNCRRRRRRRGPPRCASPTRATHGTGSWSSTSAARSCRPQAAARAMIEAGTRRHGRQHLRRCARTSASTPATRRTSRPRARSSSLTRQWATEWAKHGINVNAIRPTFVDTPQVASLLGDPDVQGGHRQPDPARARRGDATTSPARSSSLLGRRVVRHRPGPRHRRRPHGDPVGGAARWSRSRTERLHRRRSCAAATRASCSRRTASSSSTPRSCRRRPSRCGPRSRSTARSST